MVTGAGCIFCAIVAREAPGRVVYEDERTLAFLDIFPLTRGHTLVVPKRHCTDLLDAPADDLAAVAATAQRVARVAMAELGSEGINLLQATGAVAFQTVFHLHVHVLPRYRDDGFRLQVERHRATDDELDAVAQHYASLG